jgi:hypothetical protein
MPPICPVVRLAATPAREESVVAGNAFLTTLTLAQNG